MPTLGSSSSAENKDMTSKNMNQWGYNYLTEYKTLCKKEKLLVTSNFSFSHNVFKNCLLLMRQNEYLWSKGLIGIFSASDSLWDRMYNDRLPSSLLFLYLYPCFEEEGDV